MSPTIPRETPYVQPTAQPPISRGDGARLGFIDALRGISALAVLASHTAEHSLPGARELIATRFDLGHFGVILFFLCSGFVIPVSLERQRSLAVFWIKRICRLYPLYWFSIALAVITGYAASARTPGQFWQANQALILSNLTMLELFLGYPYIHGEYWTLMFEMLFYAIVTGLFVLGALGQTLRFTIGLMLAAVLAEALLPLLLPIRVLSGTISFLALMFLGAVFYRQASDDARPGASIGLVLLGLAMIAATALGDPRSPGGLWQQAATLAARSAALLVFGAVFLLRDRAWPRALRYFGTISFSIYLLQATVLLVRTGSPLLNMLLWPALTLAGASLTYAWIERPGIQLGQYLAKRARSR